MELLRIMPRIMLKSPYFETKKSLQKITNFRAMFWREMCLSKFQNYLMYHKQFTVCSRLT